MEVDIIIQECNTYMSTDEGKSSILYTAGIFKTTDWITTNIEERIKSRIDLYVKNVLLSDDVEKRYINIAEEIQSVHGQKTFSAKTIERDSRDIHPLNDNETESFTYLIRVFAVFPVLFLIVLSVLALPIAVFICFAVCSVLPFGLKHTISKVIDDKYEKCRGAVPTIIRTHLDKHFVVPIFTLVDDVIKGLFQAKETKNKKVSEKLVILAANRHFLDNLDREIRTMEETVTSLQRKLELSNVKNKSVLSYLYDLLPC